MKIDLSEKEYRSLLDILYIADWVLNAHEVGSDESRNEQYALLEQKIFSHAKDMGFENLIKYDPALKEYLPTKEYEETSNSMDLIEEFEDQTFWEELINRLAERDLIKQAGGVEKISKLSFDDRISEISPLEEKYAVEFETNGLDNLKIA